MGPLPVTHHGCESVAPSHVVSYADLNGSSGAATRQRARDELTSALKSHGFVYVSKPGLGSVLDRLLELQLLFFRRATAGDKRAAALYRKGIARGYVPAKDTSPAALFSDRVERLVFSFRGNAVPKEWKLLGTTTQELIDSCVAPIAQCVLHSVACDLADRFPQYGDEYSQFFGFNEDTHAFTPTLQANTLYYPAIDSRRERRKQKGDATLTLEPPHVDLSALTLIPRANARSTQVFDPVSQKWQESYGEGVSEDALLVFNGKTQENLTYAFLEDADGTSRSLYPALTHSAEMDSEHSDRGRVVTACFVNGEPGALLKSLKTGHAFYTVSDRRPERLREMDPLPTPRTVASRVYLSNGSTQLWSPAYLESSEPLSFGRFIEQGNLGDPTPAIRQSSLADGLHIT